ncbi:MAG: hypothetical protein BGP04_05535 [Rhizobiales bacterium 62-17]|nr:hypothetical protein [Hyphomicrobiales bacterium]OJY02779.1 MAG: hypothetical protein BGP04_05535 [Rhizobiales bacterium 62-17]
MKRFALALPLSLASATAASAGTVDTPRCRTDLAQANALIQAVDTRTYKSPPRRNDYTAACTVLRQNRVDMRAATKIMQRCMTGRDRDENIGQMVASLGDIEMVLARNCR